MTEKQRSETVSANPLPPLKNIPKDIWAIGCVAFLANISTVMVFSFSAVYMKSTLGIAVAWIGLLEAVVEATAMGMRIFSGVISDFLRRRKLIVVIGYSMVVISRPVLASISSYIGVFTGRMLDRLGNGIQATPRDALVGDLSPPEMMGSSYGLTQSLKTFGSFVGGLLAMLAMWATGNNFQSVFWLATLPAVAALAILISVIRDPQHKKVEEQKVKPKNPINWQAIPRLGKPYWYLMIVVGIFMMARISEAFLLLHAHTNFSLHNENAPLVLILYNLTYSLSSYPMGRLSDKVGRYPLLAVGIGFLILADLILASAGSLTVLLVGISLWGIQMGITSSMFMTLIAESVPEDIRGTGFGVYYLINAISLFIATSGGGLIAQYYGEGMAFFSSSIIASLSLICLFLIRPHPKKIANKIEIIK